MKIPMRENLRGDQIEILELKSTVGEMKNSRAVGSGGGAVLMADLNKQKKSVNLKIRRWNQKEKK